MNAATARMVKEARALFWPWCAVVLVGFLQFLEPRFRIFRFAYFGFWAGPALLAAVSLGNEFQHRTLPLLLSQPVDRKKMWLEKWLVLVGAVLCAATVYLFVWPDLRQTMLSAIPVAVWIITPVCSAAFWTLATRSTIGGLVFTVIQGIAFISLADFVRWKLGPEPPATVATAVAAGSMAGMAAYALVLLWLGRRKFVRFEATGEVAASDSFMLGPGTRGSRLTQFLRSRPSGPLMNLIRREVRMLWPVWLLMAAGIVATAGIGAFHRLAGISADTSALTAGLFIAGLNALSMVLAGSLSMGEERTLGTHALQLTLPLSSGLQWLVKLSVALFASLAGLALPVFLAQIIFGEAFAKLLPGAFLSYGILYLLWVSSIVSFSAFWCACAVKGTVKAALWVFPAFGLVLSATSAGVWLAGLLVMSDLTGSALLRFHPFPFAEGNRSLVDFTIGRYAGLLMPLAPLALALMQTRRLFRREITDTTLSVVRFLAPVAILAFVSSFATFLPFVVVQRAEGAIYQTIYETHLAAGKLPGVIGTVSTLQQITPEDLAKSAPLSNTAMTLLRDSTITIRPRQADARWLQIHNKHSEYFTTIRFRNNWQCTAYGGPYMNCRTAEGESIGVRPP